MGLTDRDADDADEGLLDAFLRPGPELAPIVDKVLRMPEHRNLVENGARIHFLMRAEPKVKQGRQVLGTCYMPRVNGELSSMFDWLLARFLGEEPDFLVVLDGEWWAAADAHQREILVFHELMHAAQADDANGEPKFNAQTGEPVWCIRGHDIEEFNAVARRYGAWSDDLEEFIEAVREGDAVATAGLRRLR